MAKVPVKQKDTSALNTDIVLIDIIHFSKLSSHEQVEIITFITKSYTVMISKMLENSEMPLQKLITGFITTGDGFYCIINPRLKGFGAILALNFHHFSDLIAQRFSYFRGIRTAVHTGFVYRFTDILGHDNFVGSGLNDCARYLELKDYTISTVVISLEAYEAFEKFLELYPDYHTLMLEHQFKRSQEYRFLDKHMQERRGYLIWLRKGGIINPPNINFNSLLYQKED